MGKIKIIVIIIVCFVLVGVIKARLSAEEIVLPIAGGVYHMISFPYMPEDRDPQMSLIDDLGHYNTMQWRFFRYDSDLFTYVELKSREWDPSRHDLDFGRGYWIISRNPTEIDIEGAPNGRNWIVLNNEGDGWNQVGNIFDYDFPIVSLYVALDSAPDDQKQLIDEAANDLTYVTLQEFENGTYVDIPGLGKTTVAVGKAYWLRVRDGVNEKVRLYFQIRASALSEEVNLSEEFFERVAQQEDPPDPPPAIESSSSPAPLAGGSGGGGGGCFIATAAYGDYDHPNVQILREFRDRYLLTNCMGRIFVDTYYRYSPTLARLAANSKSIQAVARLNLMPVIGMSAVVSTMNVYGFLIVLAFPFIGSFLLLRRRKGAWGRWKSKFSRKSKEGKGKG
jgi:hypothetical protein